MCSYIHGLTSQRIALIMISKMKAELRSLYRNFKFTSKICIFASTKIPKAVFYYNIYELL